MGTLLRRRSLQPTPGCHDERHECISQLELSITVDVGLKPVHVQCLVVGAVAQHPDELSVSVVDKNYKRRLSFIVDDRKFDAGGLGKS